MLNRIIESAIVALIVLALVTVTSVPALVAIAHFTPVSLPLLFSGTTAVGVIGILIGVLGKW